MVLAVTSMKTLPTLFPAAAAIGDPLGLLQPREHVADYLVVSLLSDGFRRPVQRLVEVVWPELFEPRKVGRMECADDGEVALIADPLSVRF
jgi:hypothetical protein